MAKVKKVTFSAKKPKAARRKKREADPFPFGANVRRRKRRIGFGEDVV